MAGHGSGTHPVRPRELLTEEQFSQFGGVYATITASPRPDLPAELRAEGIEAHNGWTAEDFAPYQATIDTIRLLNLVVLAVGLGAFLLGTADLAMGRRAEHARLRLLGTPVGVLRRAHWLEVSLPLVVGEERRSRSGSWSPSPSSRPGTVAWTRAW